MTRPMPRDPESGEGSDSMTGACLTIGQVQSIPWAAAPSSASLLLVTSVFVTPIVTRRVVAKPCTTWVAAVVGAPVSFSQKETGARWRKKWPNGMVAAGQRSRGYVLPQRAMRLSRHPSHG